MTEGVKDPDREREPDRVKVTDGVKDVLTVLVTEIVTELLRDNVAELHCETV